MADETTRDRILRTAQDLFTTKGFANASVREICEEAAITPPTLYYHFGDKEGLFAAVVEDTLSLDDFLELLRRAVAVPSTPRAKLGAYVGTYLTGFPADFLNPGLHLQDSTQVNGTSLRRVQTGISDVYRLTQDFLRAGIEAGAFREVDVDTTASCLMGIVDSFVRARVYLGVDYDVEQIKGCVVDLLMRGLVGGSDD